MRESAAPVKLISGAGSLASLSDLVGNRSAVLVTSPGMVRRGVQERIRDLLGNRIAATWANVRPNPTLSDCEAAFDEVGDRARVFIGLGGGSTLDTAKTLAAMAAPGAGRSWLRSHLKLSAGFPCPFEPRIWIGIPTTAGTASEVTPWGTVWDEETGAKYSLSHGRLYAESAVADPELTVSCSVELTLTTALDALSHAMESVWNVNGNPESDCYAEQAIRIIMRDLPGLLEVPGDLVLRDRIQEASILAGLAFRRTRTALAHSLSYPLTAMFGLPHGLACSFTLAEVLRLNGDPPKQVIPILRAMEVSSVEEGAKRIEAFFRTVGLGGYLRQYWPQDGGWRSNLKGRLLDPSRAGNNLTPVDETHAIELLERAATALGQDAS